LQNLLLALATDISRSAMDASLAGIFFSHSDTDECECGRWHSWVQRICLTRPESG
jgi:hypothetical protein